MNSAIAHYYAQNRRHQIDTYGPMTVVLPTGEKVREFTGGGAAYGFHAVAAFQGARRTIHFRKTLSATVKASKKRSAAAKRGWKTRRAAA